MKHRLVLLGIATSFLALPAALFAETGSSLSGPSDTGSMKTQESPAMNDMKINPSGTYGAQASPYSRTDEYDRGRMQEEDEFNDSVNDTEEDIGNDADPYASPFASPQASPYAKPYRSPSDMQGGWPSQGSDDLRDPMSGRYDAESTTRGGSFDTR